LLIAFGQKLEIGYWEMGCRFVKFVGSGGESGWGILANRCGFCGPCPPPTFHSRRPNCSGTFWKFRIKSKYAPLIGGRVEWPFIDGGKRWSLFYNALYY